MEKILLSQYAVPGNKGDIQHHYEYKVNLAATSDSIVKNGSKPNHSGAFGIGIVEALVSSIVGRKARFYLLNESRFFSAANLYSQWFIMDISIKNIEPDSYRVYADITNENGVLMEIAGNLAAES